MIVFTHFLDEAIRLHRDLGGFRLTVGDGRYAVCEKTEDALSLRTPEQLLTLNAMNEWAEPPYSVEPMPVSMQLHWQEFTDAVADLREAMAHGMEALSTAFDKLDAVLEQMSNDQFRLVKSKSLDDYTLHHIEVEYSGQDGQTHSKTLAGPFYKKEEARRTMDLFQEQRDQLIQNLRAGKQLDLAAEAGPPAMIS